MFLSISPVEPFDYSNVSRHMSLFPSSGFIHSGFLISAIHLWLPLEMAIHVLLLAFKMMIHALLLAFETVTHVQLRLFRTPRSVSLWYCPECFYPNCPKGYQERLWALTVIFKSFTGYPLLSVISMASVCPVCLGEIGDADIYNRIIRIQWSTQANLLSPGSSASISDLDQAAALATALALALVAPLKTLASLARAQFVRQ